MSAKMKRREFITLLGGAAASWPMAAHAQQSAIPVIGYLNIGSPESDAPPLTGLRRGLSETGYVEGRNFVIEYRWAGNQVDRLPALAAKTVTTTIPIVFETGTDPVQLGLVTSLNRPGGNITGVTQLIVEVAPKWLGLLHELVPTANRVGVLVNPADVLTETALRDVQPAARAIGLQIQVVNASTSGEIDAAFAAFVREQVDALFIGPGGVFSNRRVHIANQAMRHGIPATYSQREFPEIGGLMSYGTNLTDSWRQVGIYAGRVLKGAKPADLPVVQSTKLELVIIAQTARLLGLTIPPGVLAIADEVIE